MTAIVTRPAVAGDHPAYARLFAELDIPDPVPDRAKFEQYIVPRVSVACVGAADGDVVGYVTWRAYGATAHVINIAVDPAWRGRAVGAALLERVRGLARDAGCTRWYLNVKRDNAPALRLYARSGFALESETWALSIAWAAADAMAIDASVIAGLATEADDAAIGARLGFLPERVAAVRTRPGSIPVVLRAGAVEIAGFAAFDPGFPGASPFAAIRPALAGALVAACRAHAQLDRFDFIRIAVERDAALKDALITAGAELAFEILQLGAAI